MKVFLLFIVIFCSIHLTLSAPASAEITSIPGLKTKVNFKQYGGYINVNEAQDRNLYYWFVESQSKPATDPLFLWMQGGPGCSSLFGFLTEHGPFLLSPNLELYPEFQQNDFYVSGESYGGHYVPQLSWTILQENKNATFKINLKGMLAGNPWTDDDIDSWAVPTFIYYHHLCSLPTWERVLQYCIDNTTMDLAASHSALPSLSLIDSSQPFFDHKPRKLRGLTDDCDDALNQMYKEVGDDINQYDIYAPCVDPAGVGLDCSNYTAQQDFFNNPEVQAAIHAKAPPSPGWVVCADVNFEQAWPSVLPIYPELMDNIHVTVYGGDVTFNVPVLGTQIWVENFQREVLEDYKAWTVGGQVAGYYKKFKGITYVTVKDSGHMVPTYTPAQGKALFEAYLAGTF